MFKGVLGSVLLVGGLLVSAPVRAQTAAPPPRLSIFADTAGVSAIGDSTYLTWVFAKASPRALPSSGILVGFDCKNQKVQRFAHVVYHLTADSASVTGATVEDSTGWVPVTIPRLFNLICAVGPTHGTWHDALPSVVAPDTARPKSATVES